MENAQQRKPGRIVTRGTEEQEHKMKLPLLGKLKVGIKVPNKDPNKQGYPASLDYFRATGDYAAKFDEAYPNKPKQVGIIFISDNVEQSCNQRWELRDKKGRLLGSGDGLNFKIWSVKEEKYLDKVADTEAKQDAIFSMGEWYCILTLEFVVPKINGLFGCWRFETKGTKSTMRNIIDTFDMIKSRAGTVVNVPFDLSVKKVTSQNPGDTKTYSVVDLIPNITDEKMTDVREWLSAGNSAIDIPKLLQGKVHNELPETNDTKALPETTEAKPETTAEQQRKLGI